MDYVVAIPSHARPETLAAKTLPLLLGRGVPGDRVEIWVDQAEWPVYEETLGAKFDGSGVQLRVGAATLAGNRAALQAAHDGEWVVEVDDDLSDVIERVDAKRRRPVDDLAGFFSNACEFADEQGVVLWGIYPVANPYFMKERVRLDLSYIVGCLFGLRANREIVPTMDDKEDFERSIQAFEMSGAVARFEWVAPITNYYGEPGGMQTTRTRERVEAGARSICDRWPALARYKVSKGRDMPEVVLRGGATRALARPF